MRHSRRPSNQTPRVLAYTRVSTLEQARSGHGLEAQRQTIRQEAQRRGWKQLQIIKDDGWSAKDLKRPGIREALELLASGEADTLIVAKLDRLSRSLLDFAGLMERSQSEGWSLICLDLGVDTSTPGGEMVANVMASFAQFERRLIGERTSAALQAAKAAGKRLGRPRRMDSKTLRIIARKREAGWSLAKIADHLRDKGIATTHGGQSWYASTVHAALKSLALDRISD